MLEHLLGGFEALGHFVLGFFCGAVVVVSCAVDGLMDGPDFALLLEGHRVVHL